MITIETITGYYHEKLAKTGSFDLAFKKAMWKAYLAGREERDEPLPFDCTVWNEGELRETESAESARLSPVMDAAVYLSVDASEGWTLWHPSLRRPTPDAAVRVRLRNGNIYTGIVSNLRWTQTPPGTEEHGLDIVAYKVLEVEESADGGWTKWGGGDCPVDEDAVVVAKTGFGSIMEPCLAKSLRWEWSYCGGGGDIVAYRVMKS